MGLFPPMGGGVAFLQDHTNKGTRLIYICIPTHNEQQTVGVVLWKLRQVLTEFPRDYQLLVADDASTDKTSDVLEPYTRVLPLTVIRSETRQGAAASLEMLLREAVRRSEYPRRDVIVTMQADFSEEPDDIVPFIKRLEAGADVAVGNKVTSTKETRSRRLARSIAGFLARGQKWPEGVATPFDGYRAYRLQAVKRAIGDRGERRLIRFDGWAGHAELLRAVLPHARRVDVVDVEDRADRLQRPRRERPFASAFQVRAMSSAADPQGLVSVEELDRIASTASRSRDRSAAALADVHAYRASKSNGASGRRDRRSPTEPRQARTRANGAAAPARERRQTRERRTGEAEAAAPRPRRQQRRQPSTAAAAAPAEVSGPGVKATGPKPAAAKRAQARAAQADAAQARAAYADTAQAGTAEVDALDASAATGPVVGSPADTAAAPVAPKKKRRRRKRSGQGAARAQADAAGGEASAGEAPDGGPADSGARGEAVESATVEIGAGGVSGSEAPEGPDGEAVTAGARKRRRRGGRRGGKGRRRPKPEGSVETEAAGTADADGAAGRTDTADRTDSDQEP